MGYTSFEALAVWKRSARLAVTVSDAWRDCRDYWVGQVQFEGCRVEMGSTSSKP